MNRPRVDWLLAFVWFGSAALVVLMVLALLGGIVWLVERLVLAFGPWVIEHVNGFVAVVVAVGIGAIAVLAKKDKK